MYNNEVTHETTTFTQKLLLDDWYILNVDDAISGAPQFVSNILLYTAEVSMTMWKIMYVFE